MKAINLALVKCKKSSDFVLFCVGDKNVRRDIRLSKVLLQFLHDSIHRKLKDRG